MAEKKKSELPDAPPPASQVETKARGGILTVRGPEAGRWRAGVRFGKTPVELELSKLSDDEIRQIENDPLLSVTRS